MDTLIVDDGQVFRKTMEKIVAGLGNTPILASDGAEAWEIWQRERIPMVISDWEMPVMNGLELVSKIREAEGLGGEYTYIILLTVRDKAEDVVRGLQSGADDYVVKPFNANELIARIKGGERVLRLQTKDMIIFTMAKLAESRDPETGRHLDRIREYVKVLAQELRKVDRFSEVITAQFISDLYLTSPLHDIGKIGIPDSILLKPGRLDDQEFDLMKMHSVIGYDTLNEALQKYPKAAFIKMAAEIARSHHERVDGTGYPDGLRGDDIPIAARIVGLADVYDALINQRVYKKAFSHDVARQIIVGDSARHFDSDIVNAFLVCETRFVNIYKMFQDAGAAGDAHVMRL